MSTGGHQGSLVKSQLLYQLSYAGAPVIVFAESSSACRRSHGHPAALLSKLLSHLKAVVTPRGGETGKFLEFPDRISDARDLKVASERNLGLVEDASWGGKRIRRTWRLGRDHC